MMDRPEIIWKSVFEFEYAKERVASNSVKHSVFIALERAEQAMKDYFEFRKGLPREQRE